ncbi:DNA topoisomerase VI subunit B [Caldiplasma sukawensis]
MAQQKKVEKYRQTSISEFFEKNRHMLGFDSPQKSLFMIVKEAVDNSLDACEESGILPDISVNIEKIRDDVYEITVQDNGPGIERKEVPKVFGSLLYGSRFHVIRQSRGQQGIGITAAVLYGQITTGEPSEIITKRNGDLTAYRIVLGINVKSNEADIKNEEPYIWDRENGTSIKIKAKGKYISGKQSVFEYLNQISIINPDARIKFNAPDGTYKIWERKTEEAPEPPKVMKPHPHGIELGELLDIIYSGGDEPINKTLFQGFSRMSMGTAEKILENSGIPVDKKSSSITREEGEKILQSFYKVQILPPPPDSISPIGENFLRLGVYSQYDDLRPAFFGKPTRGKVRIYKGNPFSVEAVMVYGGELEAMEQIRVVRYANKVPLLFQAGSCAITKAIGDLDWRPYNFDQKLGKGIPIGPAIILVHVFGPKIPYTSESKEAIAQVDEIVEEIKDVIKGQLRQLRKFNNRVERNRKMGERFRLVNTIIPQISKKCSEILKLPEPDINSVMSAIANVVFIQERIENREGKTLSITEIFNYRSEPVSFKLKIVFPDFENDYTISNLKPANSERIDVTIETSIKEYPGAEYYFTGINPVFIQGADELPADWDVKKGEKNE